MGAPILLAALLAGCGSTTVINEYRGKPAAAIKKGEAVVVLGRRNRPDHETEADFIECVGDSLSDGGKDVKVIPEKKFINSMYPYFEASTAPMNVKNLGTLMQNPAVAKKLRKLNLRYFVWIDGDTQTTDKKGTLSCAIGPGGGGCFGFLSWEDQSNYEATIWDFKKLALSGKISAQTDGTSYVPAVIVPIPLLARVQAHACKSMAERISQLLEQSPTTASVTSTQADRPPPSPASTLELE
ncbi:MAG: hypothetical protein P8126_00145 [Gammaproteobacteria bacterium]